MSSSDISITTDQGALEDGAPAVVLEIQTDRFELNVWVAEHETPLLRQVEGFILG